MGREADQRHAENMAALVSAALPSDSGCLRELTIALEMRIMLFARLKTRPVTADHFCWLLFDRIGWTSSILSFEMNLFHFSSSPYFILCGLRKPGTLHSQFIWNASIIMGYFSHCVCAYCKCMTCGSRPTSPFFVTNFFT